MKQKEIFKTAAWAAWVALAILVLWVVFKPTDSTDRGRFGRSGVVLVVDDLTGCHYLRAPWGGIAPRMNADGTQICTGHEDE